MQGKAIVPQDDIPGLPFLCPETWAVFDVRPQLIQQAITVLVRQADNPRTRPATEVERLLAGFWMANDQRMHGTGAVHVAVMLGKAGA